MTEYTPGEPATWTWPDAYGDDMSAPTVCAVCRHRPVPPDRSVCETCVPPEVADAERANLLRLLARLVGNHDTRCSLDHHGFCQAHRFAPPCPVPEAQKLTGAGTTYVRSGGVS